MVMRNFILPLVLLAACSSSPAAPAPSAPDTGTGTIGRMSPGVGSPDSSVPDTGADRGEMETALAPDTASASDVAMVADVRGPDAGAPDTGTVEVAIDMRPSPDVTPDSRPDSVTPTYPMCGEIGANCFYDKPNPAVFAPGAPKIYGPEDKPGQPTYICASCNLQSTTPVTRACWANEYVLNCKAHVLCIPPGGTCS